MFSTREQETKIWSKFKLKKHFKIHLEIYLMVYLENTIYYSLFLLWHWREALGIASKGALDTLILRTWGRFFSNRNRKHKKSFYLFKIKSLNQTLTNATSWLTTLNTSVGIKISTAPIKNKIRIKFLKIHIKSLLNILENFPKTVANHYAHYQGLTSLCLQMKGDCYWNP